MKKNKISVLALVLAATMMLVACGGPNEPSASNTTEPPATSAGGPTTSTVAPVVATTGFPLVDEKITFDVFATMDVPAFKFDYATNMSTTTYEEKTNVHINMELVTGDLNLQTQKLNFKLASGDYPDIFLRTPITRTQLAYYGGQGLFIPLNDLIGQYGTSIKKMFTDVDGLEDSLTAPDGNIYGLPYLNLAYHMLYNNKMWLNQAWLKTLNLETPTTTDEFYEVLKAFKEKDPNGNGIADEIPLASEKDFLSGGLFPYLMNAFVPMTATGKNFCILEGDKIIAITDKPEFRDGLRYIAKLFKEGLIAPNTLTMDRTQRTALGMNEPVILGAAPATWTGHFIKSSESAVAGSRFWDYQAIPPLKGPNGLQVTQLAQYDYPGNSFSITRECTNPEIAMRWVDWMYSEEGTKTMSYGPKWNSDAEAVAAGYGWRDAVAGEVGSDGNAAIWRAYGYIGDSNSAAYNLIYPFYQSTTMHTGNVVDNPELSYERNLWEVTDKMMVPYADNSNVPPLFMSEEAGSMLAEQETIINSAIIEGMARFVTGDQDIETDWASFADNLDALGLQDYVATYQQEYDNNRK